MAEAETCLNLRIESVSSILSSGNELFNLKDIDVNYLPRNSDILAYIYYLKAKAPYHTKFVDLYISVANKTIDIWKKTEIATVTERHVKTRIAAILSKYKQIKRKIRGNKFNDQYLQFMNSVFNITRCSCETFVACHCSFKQGLNSDQYLFLCDQTNGRKLEINNFFCDANETQTLTDSIISRTSDLSIKSPDYSQKSSAQKASAIEYTSAASPDFDSSEDEIKNVKDDRHDTDYISDASMIVPGIVKLPTCIQSLNINRAIQESMRYNTSFRETASIINAISENEKGLVVTECLLRRRAKKLGYIISKSWINKNRQNELNCFFFDGVSAYNNMPVKKNDKMVADRSILFDNIVIVAEPNGRYVGFTPTPDSDAESTEPRQTSGLKMA
jgi:hypothetical protein